MSFVKRELAEAKAEAYRDRVVDLLRAKGYTITNGTDWSNKINPSVVVIGGAPEVRFHLQARAANPTRWSEYGHPDLEFHPGFASGRRITHWREPRNGWNEKTAARHADTLDKFIQDVRRSKQSERARQEVNAALDERAEAINARLKTSETFYAARAGSRIEVKVRSACIHVAEDRVESLLQDLCAVLQRYGVK